MISNVQKRVTYILAILLLLIWGLDFVICKAALSYFEPMILLTLKYAIGIFVVIVIKLIKTPKTMIKPKHIPIFFLCALMGEIGYFGLEYSAIKVMPVALVTVILAFVPIFSILIERVVFKQKIHYSIVFGIIISVLGVGIIVGPHFGGLGSKSIIGLVMAFAAAFLWSAYNFLTESLQNEYDDSTITLFQVVAALCIMAPYAIWRQPDFSGVSTEILIGVIYLGIFGTGVAYLIYIRIINHLGSTTAALFANFLPLSSAILAWMVLGEKLSLIQAIGAIIVVVSTTYVIKKKDKMVKNEKS